MNYAEYTSIAAIVIALAAFALNLHSLWLQRKQRREIKTIIYPENERPWK